MPTPRPRAWRLLVAGSAVVLGLAGCGGGSEAASEPSAGVDGEISEITVFAAASLTEAFTEIGKDFEAANPDAEVKFNFAGSSTLARQINKGAPVDVFASADEAQMQVVTDAHNTEGDPTVFAQNKLQIVVPKGNPADVEGLAAFGTDDLDIALCAEEVPCGVASQEVLLAAGVTVKADTLEQNVKAVLTKASLGEIDAGLVYVTDVASADGDVEGIDFTEADAATNEYPIAVLQGAPNSEAAQKFVDYVLSGKGTKVLDKYGFVTDVS